MTRYGLYVANETRKDGEARKGFKSCEAANIDEALSALMPLGGIVSASNAPSHVKHDAAKRRFSHGGTNYRVQAVLASDKAPTKADISRDLAVANAMIAVLAKRGKLTDATLATLRAECEAAIPGE